MAESGDTNAATRKRANRWLTWQLWAFAAGAFGFGFALVPLYSVLCKVTGYGDKKELLTAAALPTKVDSSRWVRVEFMSTNPTVGEWEFHPVKSHIEVHPGQLYEASFIAKNMIDKPVVAQAVPSITPSEATQYFRKTQCFCFSPQSFAALQTRELKVHFYVDPALPRDVDRVTLAYAMFDIPLTSTAAR
ncbi:MAG TPA: cytochrome c oxidase assembly protein [Steroidobacteraceae bacterium]|nr:cytochrome c oxidase assembly protein [Steroidobacteraceae bacterium]